MSSIKRLIGLCCLPVVCWILVTLPACGTEEGTGPRREIVTIDDQGGALVLENAEVTVPPGALAGARELTMTEGAEPPVGIPEEYEQASEYYTLEPHGLVFATPVTVRLPYQQVGYPPDLLRLDDDNDTTWEPVPGVTFTDREASLQTDHFCHLVIGGRKKCKDQDGDGYGIACDAGWDCDDHDPDVHPDGTESPHHAPACQNQKDDDCDGLTDLDDPDCVVCTTDADCDDGMYCTDPDTCTGGECTTLARDCSQLDDACNVGACDEMFDQCVTGPRVDGTPCDDGLYCTINDACQSGSCTLRDPQDCDDGDACTQDACDEAGNQCIHILVPNPGAEGPAQPGTCSNGVDDDCDGLTDTDDPDC